MHQFHIIFNTILTNLFAMSSPIIIIAPSKLDSPQTLISAHIVPPQDLNAMSSYTY